MFRPGLLPTASVRELHLQIGTHFLEGGKERREGERKTGLEGEGREGRREGGKGRVNTQFPKQERPWLERVVARWPVAVGKGDRVAGELGGVEGWAWTGSWRAL